MLGVPIQSPRRAVLPPPSLEKGPQQVKTEQTSTLAFAWGQIISGDPFKEGVLIPLRRSGSDRRTIKVQLSLFPPLPGGFL